MNKNIKYVGIAGLVAVVGFGGWVANNHMGGPSEDELALRAVVDECFHTLRHKYKLYVETGPYYVCQRVESVELWNENKDLILSGKARVEDNVLVFDK